MPLKLKTFTALEGGAREPASLASASRIGCKPDPRVGTSV